MPQQTISKLSIFVVLGAFALAFPLAAQTAPETAPALQLIHELGCKGCHRIQAEGGSLGPNLTRIGNRMTVVQIQHRLKQHGNQTGDRFRPAYDNLSTTDFELISHYLHQLQ